MNAPMMPPEGTSFEPCQFALHDYFDPDGVAGYSDGSGWSGGANAYFEKETVRAIAEKLDATGITYDEDTDTFTLQFGFGEDGPDTITGFDVTVNGETLHLYDLSEGWAWQIQRDAPEVQSSSAPQPD